MDKKQKQVWIFVGAGAAVLATVGLYFFIRSLQSGPSSSNIKRVEAIIKEAEDLIRHHR